MVEYFETLVESREYQNAVNYGERLLSEFDFSPRDLLRINCGMLTSLMYLRRYHAAVAAGEVALRLAVELQEWDKFGVACLDLGGVYYRLGRMEEALTTWLNYLSKLSLYTEAAGYETLIWYNIGRIYTAWGDSVSASKALSHALEAANRIGDARQAHGIRQALIDAYMDAEQVHPIPMLLARCGNYLRDHPHTRQYLPSLLWHLRLRSEFLVFTSRWSKARRFAVRGLELATGMPRHLYDFHMLLVRIALAEGSYVEALGHALAARSAAIKCGRIDLEGDAGRFIFDILEQCPNASGQLAEHYQMEWSIS